MGDAAGVLLVGQVVEADDGDDAPFALPRDPGFVLDPAGVRSHDGDRRSRLKLADEGVIARPVVDLAFAVRSFGAGAVEPDLGDLPVVRQKFPELVLEVLVVPWRIAVARLVAIPRREVDAEFQAGLAAGRRDLADDVALAFPPGRVLDRMIREAARPEAEPVVVLGCDDEAPDPGGLDRLDPLAGVEIRGIEELRVFRALPPFSVSERVHAEMDEGLEFERLPGELPLGRHDPGRLRDELGNRVRREDVQAARDRRPFFMRHRPRATGIGKNDSGQRGRDDGVHRLERMSHGLSPDANLRDINIQQEGDTYRRYFYTSGTCPRPSRKAPCRPLTTSGP